MGQEDVYLELKQATRRVGLAGDYLDKLTGPPGDDPEPYNFEDALRQLPLLKEAVRVFEEKLSARPEVSEGG